MNVLIRLFYAGALMALLVLFVAFGVRTFYGPPTQPRYPDLPASMKFGLVAPVVPGQQAADLTPEQQQYFEAQQRYQEEFDRYLDRRASYHRDVMLIAVALGVLAAAAGLALPGRLDAVRLGLVAGSLATLLYGIAQAGPDFDRIGPTVIFVLALIGLALMLGAGSRWLSTHPTGDAKA